MNDNPPLVHIVDDDADIRESLDMLLGSVGIRTALYPSADAFLNSYQPGEGGATCMLLDVRMPGLSGMGMLERLNSERIHMPVIMLTGHGDIPMSVSAMKLGAVDFITKPYNHQQLLELVQQVLRDPILQGKQESKEIDPRQARERWESLTSREREVFNRIVSGASNKVIGIDLGISIRTVETHRARIMEKLEVRTLVDLVHISLSLSKTA